MIRCACVALVLAAGLAACSEPPSEPLPVAEPESALRPEELRGTVPAEARIADYVLDAELDAEAHRVTGSARVTWRNATSRTVDSLPFHLYMNGFRAEDTAWMLSSRGEHRSSEVAEEGIWGYIDVRSVTLETHGGFVADEIEGRPGESVALEWSEDAEPSTMTVALPQPVGPGETVTLNLDFVTQLPRVVARTGYKDDFHAVAQWYPKIGVLEEATGWQAHPFTVYDEFYADFGNYTVVLDVPERMIVGATGIRTSEEVAEGRKRLTYEAEMVHDFAWMASPDFVEHYGEYEGVRIRQLIQPERAGDAEAHLAAQLAAFRSYEERYGPYPWSTLTIVHAPEGAEGAGGMEYPTLFTTTDRDRLPGWVRAHLYDERVSGVSTTVHEFGHQYFQGLLASREHLEPWLDEGVNTYSNVVAAGDRLGGDNPWILRLRSHEIRLKDFVRLRLGERAFLEPVDQRASEFESIVGHYGATVYGKTAALLLTLRNLSGTEAFDRAMRTYVERARFRQPRGEDLEAVLVAELGEVAGLDVREYLDRALRSTDEVDFELRTVVNRRRPGTLGWRRGAGGELEGGEEPDLDVEVSELPDDEVEGVVVVHRAGAFPLPVELRVEFADGSDERLVWDGRDPVRVFEWPGRRVRLAELDPDQKLLLEVRRLNNAAFARNAAAEDGLSRPLGDVAEALSLAVIAGLGP